MKPLTLQQRRGDWIALTLLFGCAAVVFGWLTGKIVLVGVAILLVFANWIVDLGMISKVSERIAPLRLRSIIKAHGTRETSDAAPRD